MNASERIHKLSLASAEIRRARIHLRDIAEVSHAGTCTDLMDDIESDIKAWQAEQKREEKKQ